MRTLLASVLLAPASALAAASAPFAGDHVALSLVSENSALVPGQTAWLGLRLQHDPHWHTYWINPGDSGLPTKLAWHLPDGFSAGEIAWPTPRRFDVGELYTFGYDGDVLLPVPLAVPAAASGAAHLVLDAKWLVCQEECIPGKATLTLELPIAAAAKRDADAARFAQARAAQPQTGKWKAAARIVGDRIEVSLRGADLGSGAGVDAFAQDGKVVANAPPRFSRRDGAAVLTFAKSDYFTSIPRALELIVLKPGAAAMRVRALFDATP